MANKHMKSCSILLTIRKMLVKTTVSYLTSHWSGWPTKSVNNKCWRRFGEEGTLLHCWWECKLVQSLRRTVWSFLKKTKTRVTIQSRNPTPCHTSGENSNLKRYIHPNVNSSAIHNNQGTETNCMSTDRWMKMWYTYAMEHYSVSKRIK